jgi:hypothetical protein
MDDGDGGHDRENPEGGGHGSPASEESAEDDQDDALGALHEAYFAGADEGFGAGAGVADHERGGHDEGNQEDVEQALTAGVEDEQAEEESDVGVAVEDGIEEGAKDGDLVGEAGDAPIDHVKEARTEDDEGGVEEHANVGVGARVAEEEGGDHIDDEAEEGEGVGGDAGESQTSDDLLQQPTAAFTECACPSHAVDLVYRDVFGFGTVVRTNVYLWRKVKGSAVPASRVSSSQEIRLRRTVQVVRASAGWPFSVIEPVRVKTP